MLITPHNGRILQILEGSQQEDVRVIELFLLRHQETGFVSSLLNARVVAAACHAMSSGLLLDIFAGLDKKWRDRFGIPWSKHCYVPNEYLQQQCGRSSVRRGLESGGPNNRYPACAKKESLQLGNWIEQVGIFF